MAKLVGLRRREMRDDREEARKEVRRRSQDEWDFGMVVSS